MILYFSSAIPYDLFNEYLASGDIATGHQAQKFNQLIINGLSKRDSVYAISNPPFNCKRNIMPMRINDTVATYLVAAGHKSGIRHKLNNFIQLSRTAQKAVAGQEVSAIVCDSINVGASFAALRLARRLGVPAIAIVTDIPEIMWQGRRMDIFSRFDAYLMKRYDAYVLLTQAMDEIVNPNSKTTILIEGTCEIIDGCDCVVKPEGKLICLYCGMLVADNGIRQLIEAFKLANVDNAELHLYGSGSLESEMEQLIGDNKNIRYCGVVTNREMVTKQRQADLLINPRPSSIFFGEYSFPSKLIEYLGSGTAVLSTRLPGIPKDYESHLYFIDDESIEGYAAALTNCLAKGRRELAEFGLASQKWAQAEKNNVKQAGKIIDLVKTLSH